ncbi:MULTISPECIES: hypothetical protein [Paracoccaceae]|uniref:hypothetical protein n=1 Tax=Paracoccaceae TaxID=31989 RepID=UPI001569AA5F|nr:MULTISPECIES: hypothetical protein [Paracoccaceae]MDV7271901.1 hypothetical protein [Thioclava sp. A2]NRP31908.1 hypothetical protein [Aliiroseovarius sp. xm-m-314]NRP81550.1 hypothetical protein [Aliiroseovarius sp. xm-v-209]
MNALNPALHTDALRRLLKRPNALHPDHMTAQERQAEICSLLALAIARPNMRTRENPAENGGNERWRIEAQPRRLAPRNRKQHS